MRVLKIITAIMFILGILAMILIIVAGLFYNLYWTSSSKALTDPVSLLIIGTDNGGNRDLSSSGIRADSLILVTFSPSNENGDIELDVVSVPRDTLAEIPCSDTTDYSKINSSMNTGYYNTDSIQGGVDCTVEAVSQLLNVPIDYYIQTSFDGLIAFIDAIGGIDIYSPYAFCTQDENGNEDAICFTEGWQHVDGQEALAYSRQRHQSSDYERAQRQQEVMLATVKKLFTDPTVDMQAVWNAVNTYFLTNITPSVASSFASYALTTLSDMQESLAMGGTINLDFVDNQEYSENTSISDSTIAKATETTLADAVGSTGVNSDNPDYEVSISIDDTKIPHVNVKNGDVPTDYTIEFNSLVLSSVALVTDSGWYSYPDEEALDYTSALLRSCLGLEPEDPNYDYSQVE